VLFVFLNMDDGILTLQFSEAVEIATFVPEEFVLRSKQSSLPAEARLLTCGALRYLDERRTMVELEFNSDDVLQIKLLNVFASSQITSFSVGMRAIQGTTGNNIETITASTALQVGQYFGDVSSPSLVRLTFDLNVGLLFLTFDDVMNNQLWMLSKSPSMESPMAMTSKINTKLQEVLQTPLMGTKQS